VENLKKKDTSTPGDRTLGKENTIGWSQGMNLDRVRPVGVGAKAWKIDCNSETICGGGFRAKKDGEWSSLYEGKGCGQGLGGEGSVARGSTAGLVLLVFRGRITACTGRGE